MILVVEQRPISPRKVAPKKTTSKERLDGASESLVLECDCKAKLVLGSYLAAQLLWHDRFECGVCEKGFLITGMVSHRYYSWMEDYLEQLEGKEARQQYYARLESGLTKLPSM
jgi:hypothetical protein